VRKFTSLWIRFGTKGWRDLAGQLARSQASTHNQKRPHRCIGCTMAALATSLSAIARVSSNAPLKRQQRNQPRGECSNPPRAMTAMIR